MCTSAEQHAEPTRSEGEDLTGDGGVIKRIVRAGEGAAPHVGAKCKIHFKAMLADGTVVDSSAERNESDAPFAVTLGQGLLVKGLEQALLTMKRREAAELLCRADYAYGAKGAAPIPPDATLTYTVELCVCREDLAAQGKAMTPDARLKVSTPHRPQRTIRSRGKAPLLHAQSRAAACKGMLSSA